MIEGLQSGPATIVSNITECHDNCATYEDTIATYFNTNPLILQCRCFQRVNELQPNFDWDTVVLEDVACCYDAERSERPLIASRSNEVTSDSNNEVTNS